MTRLTPNSIRVLREIADGRGTHFGIRGMAAHGGRSRTLGALLGAGAIDADYKITAAGRDMLLAESTRTVQGEMF